MYAWLHPINRHNNDNISSSLTVDTFQVWPPSMATHTKSIAGGQQKTRSPPTIWNRSIYSVTQRHSLVLSQGEANTRWSEFQWHPKRFFGLYRWCPNLAWKTLFNPKRSFMKFRTKDGVPPGKQCFIVLRTLTRALLGSHAEDHLHVWLRSGSRLTRS